MHLFLFVRLLETELQRVQKTAEVKEKEMRAQIDELKTDNDRQQKLIGQVNSSIISGWFTWPTTYFFLVSSDSDHYSFFFRDTSWSYP